VFLWVSIIFFTLEYNCLIESNYIHLYACFLAAKYAENRTLYVLSSLTRVNAYVFPGWVKDKPISNMTMLKLLKNDMGYSDKTVHGFRSSFRDWAAETTNFPSEVVEMALAHVIENRL